MALLDILTFPDPRLRTKAKPVETFDQALSRLVDDMLETMYHHSGVGLAATQINVHQRLFVMDISATKDQAICLVNPEIVSREGIIYESEGCLSVIDAFDKVERAQKVVVRGMDVKGKTLELTAENLLAVCIQHELDHLDGILFIDHLSRLKQDRIRKKAEKIKQRET